MLILYWLLKDGDLLESRRNLSLLNLKFHPFFGTYLKNINTPACLKVLALSFLLKWFVRFTCYAFRHLGQVRGFDLFAFHYLEGQSLGLSLRNELSNWGWFFVYLGKLSEDIIVWFIEDSYGGSFWSPVADLRNVTVVNDFLEDIVRNGRVVMPVRWSIQSISCVLMAALEIVAGWGGRLWFLELDWNFLSFGALAPCEWVFLEGPVLTHNDYWN